MKVYINGTWHDAEKEPIVINLSDTDKLNISTMHPDAKYYIVYPDNMEEELIHKLMEKVKNNQ